MPATCQAQLYVIILEVLMRWLSDMFQLLFFKVEIHYFINNIMWSKWGLSNPISLLSLPLVVSEASSQSHESA